MADNMPQSSLTREQKTGFVLLLIFGILAVGLGFLQMRNNIFSPFVVHKGEEQPTLLLLDEATRLQRIDTDQDGLHDYEELNFYQTSPYLPDTDSDGISDKVEIDKGTDPLCPAGQDCGASSELPKYEIDSVSSPLVDGVITPLDVLENSAVANVGVEVLDVETLMQNPAQLRELLLSTGGITEEQLDNIDDTALLEVVEQMLASGSENQQ